MFLTEKMVRIDPLFPAHTPARASSAYVTFEPGARTAWHTHPLGQALIITAGVGRVQVQGGPIQEVRPGDTVWFPPYVKHWHGAAPGVAMTHISVAEEEGGNNVEWLEKVTEEIRAVVPKGRIVRGNALCVPCVGNTENICSVYMFPVILLQGVIRVL